MQLKIIVQAKVGTIFLVRKLLRYDKRYATFVVERKTKKGQTKEVVGVASLP